jgi:HlyD family secretion protein
MSRRRRSKWPWIFLLLAAGGGWWWWHSSQNGKELPPEYETAVVNKGDVKKVVKASGVVNPLTKVEIGSQISGTISKLYVDFNSKVKAGDVLCELDPATYEAAHLQAEAERASAEADRDYQKKTLSRKKQLLEQKLLPQADYDKVEADLVSAGARLQLAEARVKKAKVDLDRCTIIAPMDGMIIDRTAEVGMTIAASFNAPKLFILANDLTKMQINAQVSEADIGQVHPKQKVTFKVDAYPEPFQGEVVQVRNSPISEENVVNYDAIIHVNNPEMKLKPGMTGDTDIVTADRTNVLRVPNAALRFKPGGSSMASAGGGPPSPGARPSGGGEGRRREGGGSGSAGRPGSSSGGSSASPGTSRSSGRERSSGEEAPPRRAAADQSPEREVYLHPASPDDELKPLKVQVGISDGINTEILSGLKEGDTVITLLKPPAGSGPVTNPFSGMGGGGGRRR